MRRACRLIATAAICLAASACAQSSALHRSISEWMPEHLFPTEVPEPPEVPLPEVAGSYEDFLVELGIFESAGVDDIDYGQPGNQYGYIGGWQFGEAALVDAGFYAGDRTPSVNDWKGKWTGLRGIRSKKDFLKSPEAQWHAIHTLMPRRWTALTNMGLDGYVGRHVNGVQVTASGLLAAAHLAGPGGVRDFLRSGGMLDPIDGNNTRASDYMRRFPSFETPYEEIILASARPSPTLNPGDAPEALAVEEPPPDRVVASAKSSKCEVFRSGMTIAEAAQAALDCRYKWREQKEES